jgi:hypothetical protein
MAPAKKTRNTKVTKKATKRLSMPKKLQDTKALSFRWEFPRTNEQVEAARSLTLHPARR